MPTVRYQIRNEYGLADPEVYRAAEKDDPEALLEGVAMAGLVGVLRQLGDLAEFAADVFHDLHEEVMSTSSRGHGLILRVQQLEAEFPVIEKAMLSQIDHSHSVYNSGIDWHPNLRVEQNLVIQGDMPRFVLDSYEECRGPPQLFMLDKFDVAGAGACLTRYSNPSFFKIESASSEIMESELQREKTPRKIKQKGSRWRNDEIPYSLSTPIMDYLQFPAFEPVPDKLPDRLVKLKHRNLKVSDVSNRKSYMEGLINEVLEQNDPEFTPSGSNINKRINWTLEEREVLTGGMTNSSLFREEVLPQSSNELNAELPSPERKAKNFFDTAFTLFGVSEKLHPPSQSAKEEEMLMGNGNEVKNVDFDVIFDDNDMNPPSLQLAECNNHLLDSGFITDEDHDGYRSDDVGSELENYVDALNTMEIEAETDSESRGISDPYFFNRRLPEINPKINGCLELQPQSCGPGSTGRFATLLDSDTVTDVVPSLLKSANLVDLTYQQLQPRSIVEETSSLEIKINQGEMGQVERAGECIELLPSVCSISNGTCYQKQPNDSMLAPISRDAISSSCIKDSVLKPNGNFKEEQSLNAYSEEEFSGRTRSTPEVSERAKFSFLSWKSNTAVVPPTFKEGPDVHEDDNILGHNEERISTTIIGNDHMSCNSSKTEYIFLLEKDPDDSSIISPLIPMDVEIGKSLQIQETGKNDFISGSLLSSTPMGSIVLESYDMPVDLETNMQSEYSAMKITSKYMGGHDEERRQLKSSVLFPDETHELSLLISDDSGSHESTQTSENVDDDVAYISDERGSHHGSGSSLMTSPFSGHTENTMSNDTANTFQMPESSQKCSLAEVSIVYCADSFHDLKDNEIYSVKNPSPEISDSALEIVSFNLRSECLAGEIRNIFVATEEVVHPQSSVRSVDVDICRCDLSTSHVISYELEQLPVAKEPHDSANVGILEPLLSGSGEISDATQFHPELVDLIETNEINHVNDELEVINESSKVDLHQEVLVGKNEKDNKALDDNAIAEDGTESQVLNILESAEVTTSKLCSIEDPLLEDDELYRVRPDDKELATTSDSTFFLSKNKSHFLFTQNKEQEMFIGSLSSRISVLDLSNSFDSKLVDVNVNDPHVKLYHNFKGDNIFFKENKQDADSISENVITEEDTDAKVLSTLQSSNLCRSDVQFQEYSFSEEATLNQHMSEIENLGISSQDSISKTCIAEYGTDGQILSLLESSYAHIHENLVSMEASMNPHRQEIEEPALTGDLTSLKFEREFFVPFSNRGDQEPVSVVSSSQSQALYSSNFGDATLSDQNFDDILMEFYLGLHEESLICSKEDVQDSERPEFQSEQAFVSEPSTIPINEMDENMERSNIHLDEDCSDGNTIIQYSLEPEILVIEPDPLAFLNHESNNKLNMSPSKAYASERMKTDLSILFQDVSEQPGSSIASEVLASKSLAADFISPISITNTQEPSQVLLCETFSILSQQECVEETPPLPPLPPIQWRIGNQITESSNVSKLPQIDLDQKQHFEIPSPETKTVHSSGLSLIMSSKEDGNHGHDNVAMEGADTFTLEERRPKLVNLLPGLELERSQEAPIIDTDAIAPSNSFMFMPMTGAGMYQYDYGDYGGYEGENLHNHSLSSSFPVTVHGFPHYGYPMFLREGDSSTIYDMALPEMDGDNPNWKHRFVRNKQRDPLIEAVAAHDKSTLRKVSELDPPLKTSKEDETNYLLEQIKNKSVNLKPAISGKANMLNAPSTNLKVAAILQKANAIRQACAGSDEEDDDNWS
ncbi:SCAR-like protein 1 [Platanthera guangdongensis]|uniref:Protein SCAR n=1 Tax=Platanthera guangdongensis TaxID=2320717 RepID=A0ABR2M210_9ASPA